MVETKVDVSAEAVAARISISRQIAIDAGAAPLSGSLARTVEMLDALAADRDRLAAKLAEAEQSRDEWTSIAVERGLEKEALRADLTATQAIIAQLRAENDSGAVKAAVEAERESCAKVAGLTSEVLCEQRDDFLAEGPPNTTPALMRARQAQTASEIASAIRSRSSAPPVPAPIDQAAERVKYGDWLFGTLCDGGERTVPRDMTWAAWLARARLAPDNLAALRTKLATAREALEAFAAIGSVVERGAVMTSCDGLRIGAASRGDRKASEVNEEAFLAARKAYEDTAP